MRIYFSTLKEHVKLCMVDGAHPEIYTIISSTIQCSELFDKTVVKFSFRR